MQATKGIPVINVLLFLCYVLLYQARAQALGPDYEVLDNEIVSEDLFPTIVNGAGAPSVQWSDTLGEYVMFYETKVTTPAGVTCLDDAWEIWSASAAVVEGPWTLQSIKIGIHATNRPCGARSPSFVILDNGNWSMLYNVLLENDVDMYAGWATVIAGTPALGTLPALDGLADLTHVRYDGDWYAWGIDADLASGTYGHLMYASSTNFTNNASWSATAEALDPADLTGWGTDQLVSPSIICEDGVSAYWPWHWKGMGVELGDWAFGGSVGNLSMGFASDYEYIWTTYTDNTFRNLDYMREDDYTLPVEPIGIVFYENEDSVSGLPKIGVAVDGYNGDWTMDTSNLLGRDCAL